MRPIHGCPKNFREFLTMPMATFPYILTGFFPTDAMIVCTKFEVRSFTHS